MSEFTQIEFDVRTPVDDVGLINNVRHALSLGLDELRDFEYPWGDRLEIVASGPSARRAPRSGKTLALNGSINLFDAPPTYWAGCDPQASLADFLKDAPLETVYLVASKCHPAVFEALKNRHVVLWHVQDTATLPILLDRFPVRRAVSITICAFELMARLGFRQFETWGWDGCFMDGEGHSTGQVTHEGGLNVLVGPQDNPKSFATCPTWALEAQDAIQALRGFPFSIRVRGGGMIGEILRAYLPTHIVTDQPASANFRATIPAEPA